ELIALRIDATETRAVTTDDVDEPRAPDEDRETAHRVPRHRRDTLRGLQRRVGVEPHRGRCDRDDDSRPTPEHPRDRNDRDEIEEREPELGSGHDVDETDRGHEHEAE